MEVHSGLMEAVNILQGLFSDWSKIKFGNKRILSKTVIDIPATIRIVDV